MLFMGQHLYSILFGVVMHLGAVVFQNSVQADLEKHQAAIPVLMITAVLDLRR